MLRYRINEYDSWLLWGRFYLVLSQHATFEKLFAYDTYGTCNKKMQRVKMQKLAKFTGIVHEQKMLNFSKQSQ